MNPLNHPIPIMFLIPTSLIAFIQVAVGGSDISGLTGTAERVTVMGILMLIAHVLYKNNEKLQSKFDTVMEDRAKEAALWREDTVKLMRDHADTNSKREAETMKVMTLVLEAVKESRRSSDELGIALDNNTDQIAGLSDIVSRMKLNPEVTNGI